jgi:hypothetical protein
MQSTENNHRIRVLRFEFSSTMIELTKAFTEVHRYDDRKTYKEAWTAWLAHDEIAAVLANEVERLSALGYKGDVADKLFKSGRYYFRTREPTVQRSSLWPHTPPSVAQRHGTSTQRLGTQRLCRALTPNDANGARRGSGNLGSPRKYVLLNRDLLSAMDDHIACGLRQQSDFRPASGFAEFCKLNADSDSYRSAYRSEVTRLSEIMPKAVRDKADSDKAVGDKIKKTYKNRYYMVANIRK